MIFLWGLALVAAIAWPGRLVGPLDGAPFDTALKAIAFALLLPALWWLDPAFLKTAAARTLVALAVVWKVGVWAALPQGGWCGQFLTSPQEPGASQVLARSWDVRTRGEKWFPTCSAIVSSGYSRPTQFPAWFINIPYGRDFDLKAGTFLNLAEENARPPSGRYVLNLSGSMDAPQAGTLRFLLGSDMDVSGRIDGQSFAASHGQTAEIALSEGPHWVDLEMQLTGRNWRFVPLWNTSDLFAAVATSTRPLARGEALARQIARWVTPLLFSVLFGLWLRHAFTALRSGIVMLVAASALAAAAASIAWMAGPDSIVPRFTALLLVGALAVPVPAHLRNTRGASLLVGLPWIAIIATLAMRNVGRFTLFMFGDDALTYQRFAYRIFMEGYWLEGGQRTFWNQPLYRWLCGVLHMFFGDSSAGEMLWDGYGLLVGAMFAFYLVNRIGGFRNGLAAAIAVLLTVSLGPNWYAIGRGLSEISALMFIYLSACCLLDAGTASAGRGALAGLFGILAYYTRMNHLPLVLALPAITLIDGPDAGSAFNPRRLWAHLPKRVVGAYAMAVAAGLAAFAARTWYYTGEFSLFAGTSLGFNSTGLGTSVGSFWSTEVWRRMTESVLTIVTVQDPPRFDWRSLLVVAGFTLSALGLVRVPLARRLPFGVAAMCVVAVAGGLVVRGSAYPGRFSLHLIPVAVAASMLTTVLVQKGVGWLPAS
jgi:hypothetical protein